MFGALNEKSALTEAKPALNAMIGAFGFVPNLGYALGAEPPVLARTFPGSRHWAPPRSIRCPSRFAMTAASHANGADYGVAVHATLASKLGASTEVVEALRAGSALADPKLEAVRRFATAMATKRTQVSDSDVNALTAVGFDRRAAVAIAMAVAGKTLVNTVAHLSQVEIDAGFKPMPTL